MNCINKATGLGATCVGFTMALSLLAVPAGATSEYSTSVLSDGPLAYYSFNDTLPVDIAYNSGTAGAAGNGVNSSGVAHLATGALANGQGSAVSYSGSHTVVPFQSALNPVSTKPFSVEFWVNPAVDTDDSVGPCPMFNRVSSGDRSGWVFFQRSPSTGWNFRVYSGSGSSTGVSITGGTSSAGSWNHIVAVWDGTAASLYVDGSLVAGPTVATGFKANVAGSLSIGSYDTGENPFSGSLDEVAIYPVALTAEQVQAHYNNALDPQPAVTYASLVNALQPVEYLHLDEAGPRDDVALNLGSLGFAGNGKHFPGMIHQVAGAIVGDADPAAEYTAIDAATCDGTVPTRVPFNAALNTSTFTVEAWLKPTLDGNGNAQCPLYNRREDAPRTGWVFFQRDHATGWNFRAYNGVDTARSIDLTGGPYTVGEWVHLVATFDGATGRLYANGVQVASQDVVGSFAPNTDTIQFCVGGYFDGTENPFSGSIDEVALYATALTADQVVAHYKNGTNALRTTSYTTLVQSDSPVEYIRLNEPAKNVAKNSGTLGTVADAVYVNLTNNLTGSQTVGFATNELAASFNGTVSYVELGNPAGLNFSGAITLEAWVQPAAVQTFNDADIIAHGGNWDWSSEVSLRVENGAYQIASYNSVNHKAEYTIPSEDLGTGAWVHLAGTYDGTNWNLYRNGVRVATTADSTGALLVNNANWAVGARGRWSYGPGFPDSGEDRVFLGGIDEPAIYNYALSPSRVAAHYSSGLHGVKPLTYVLSGSTLTLTWTGGTLQQSSTVNGAFADVTSASSPYAVDLSTTTQKFYRLRY